MLDRLCADIQDNEVNLLHVAPCPCGAYGLMRTDLGYLWFDESKLGIYLDETEKNQSVHSLLFVFLAVRDGRGTTLCTPIFP